MLIELLHDRLMATCPSNPKFDEGGGNVTQPHGDVMRQESAQKKAPRFPGALSRSANTD
jgi:hypothetical protein